MIPNSLLAEMNQVLDQGEAAARAALTLRLADHPEAQTLWETLQTAEQQLRAEPLIAPAAGFVQRFEARRTAARSSTSKAWFAFFGGVLATGGVTATAPLLVALALYASEVWRNGTVFAIIARNAVGLLGTVARALFTSAVAFTGIALPHPLTWVLGVSAIVIVGGWLYLMNKLTLEVSLT